MADVVAQILPAERVSNSAPAGGLRPLAWILTGGLLVRILLWGFWAEIPVRIVDAQDYNRLAVGLLTTGKYIDDAGNLTSLRPPGYPVFVSAIYWLFGMENYAAVRAVQALLSFITVLCVFRLGHELFSRTVAIGAAAAVCFYPSFLGFNNLLLSETLFIMLTTGLTLAVVLAVRQESLRWLAVAGVLLGVGALVRSILWLFAPFLACFLMLAWPGRFGRRLTAAAVPMIIFAAMIAPWAYRNTALHRTFTVIDVMGGRNAMMGNYEHTPLERNWATISLIQGERAWHRVLAAETPDYSTLTQGQIDKVAMKHGIRFVLTHPWLTMQRDVVRFFNFWQVERTLIAGAKEGFFGEIPKPALLIAALAICGSYAVGLFAGLFGAVFVPPADRRFHWFLLFSIGFPCAIHTLIFAHSRYHLPVIPLVLLYAAAAIVNRDRIWKQRSTGKFWIVMTICLIFTLAWLRELIFVDLRHMSDVIG